MAFSNESFKSALQLLEKDSKSKGVFQFMVAGNNTASGWEIAKNLSEDPDGLSKVLENLRSCGIINSQGSGLDGYYYLSDMGFKLRDYFITG